MRTVDPNEAPAGYVAMPEKIDAHACDMCALNPATNMDRGAWCHKSPCMFGQRKDGCNVYFVKKEQPCAK